MIKVDLHSHHSGDPVDKFIEHDIYQLIDHAVKVGLGALAVTCHDKVDCPKEAIAYAKSKGLILIPGKEATVEGSHVLLINYAEYPKSPCSLHDFVNWSFMRDPKGLTVLPHGFYPHKVALGHSLGYQNLYNLEWLHGANHIFDAIEYSGFYHNKIRRFNRKAALFAKQIKKPLVANSDTHFLWQLGKTYTLLHGHYNNATEVLATIKENGYGRTIRPIPLTAWEIARFLWQSKTR